MSVLLLKKMDSRLRGNDKRERECKRKSEDELMETVYRKAIRGLMITPDGKILLMQIVVPDNGFSCWITPGGGIEDGEKPDQCLRREIKEETGLQDFEIGPLIWQRKHTFPWEGQLLSQSEDFYLVPVDEFQAEMNNNPSEVELMIFRQFRWWSGEKISLSNDEFAPRLLSKHLERLINSGPPPVPVDVGV